VSGDVDAVLIATPDATHGALAIACIEAGKPVLCEKPLAPTSAECLRVIEAENRARKRLVQVGFMRRFDSAYVEMKSTLKKGVLGTALMFHCLHRNVSAPSFFDSQMAITNSASHEFDIARFVSTPTMPRSARSGLGLQMRQDRELQFSWSLRP
jgi:myo-inositol 2-dehydrogenase / D-chiro-inositol 1-dehydrogenase